MPSDRATPVLLLGCGGTSGRVARMLLAAGRRVIATTRRPDRLAPLAASGAEIVGVQVDADGKIAGLDRMRAAVGEGDVAVVHSVPPLATPGGFRDESAPLLAPVGKRVHRLVYISSTGVYGDQTQVDVETPARPVTPRQRARFDAEQTVRDLAPSTLILRAAAIYGPGRGALERMRQGRYRLVGDGTNIGSRIHVEDLARLVAAAIDSDVVGAYPVADDEPALARDVAAFAAELLGVDLPGSMPASEAHELQRVTRAVDGTAIRTALDVPLRYPTYRDGLAAKRP